MMVERGSDDGSRHHGALAQAVELDKRIPAPLLVINADKNAAYPKAVAMLKALM